METPTRPISGQERGAFEVSPALEERTSTPMSTHWIPLHELITHWTEVDTLLTPAPVAPVLAAIGHALLALARETRALRLYTQAWEKRRWNAPAMETDSLLPTDLDPAALARARWLSRIARTQQERLWKLTEEVLADRETWNAQEDQEARP